jgi:uncharacterized protein YbbC (DUF1343 family)/CubicO group peptidase (beta-lactamase class C family)
MRKSSLDGRALLTLPFVLLSLVTINASAGDHKLDPTFFAKADDAIQGAIARHEIPGAVLIAGTADQIVYRKAYGYRSLEPEKTPNALDTIYDLASLSKNVGCATSLMVLVDRGKLDVHQPVAKYLPEFGQNGKDAITVEQLLLHRGGLVPDNPMKDYENGPNEAWKKICALKTTYEPGTKMVYTDVGFIVLGKLVERVSGQPLDQFARENVFAPLDMNDTSYKPAKSLRGRIAPTEKRNGEWMIGDVHDPRSWALGGVAGHAGVFSTGDDVARWVQMLLNDGALNGKRIMSEATMREMLTKRCLADRTMCRGYGVDFTSNLSNAPRGNRFEKGTTFGHTGYTGTAYWADPVNKCFYVLLTNRVHPTDSHSKEVTALRRVVATACAEAFLGPAPTTQESDHAAADQSASGRPADVYCGIDVLKRDSFKQLDGRKVALITNHTGRDRDGNWTVELLHKDKNLQLVKLFSPEHGLYGKLDEKVGNTTDEKTGLPVFSLYGKTTRPNDEMLAGVDTLVFDIQDVGARFYTYSATLGICMEEAGKRGIRFVVLDRPNPITGEIVDGPLADEDRLGFTAFRPIATAHGMTFGELAKMYAGDFGVRCELLVVPCENWKRSMWWDQTGLTWINPSPNMRNTTQALLYTAVCLLEATNVSVGRGTDQPFELFGAPWIDARKLAAELNGANIPGLRFVPIEFTPTSSVNKEKLCHGIYVIVADRTAVKPVEAGVTIAYWIRKLFPNDFQADRVVRLLQNKAASDALLAGKSPEEIIATWKEPLEQFKRAREKYLIYR